MSVNIVNYRWQTVTCHTLHDTVCANVELIITSWTCVSTVFNFAFVEANAKTKKQTFDKKIKAKLNNGFQWQSLHPTHGRHG